MGKFGGKEKSPATVYPVKIDDDAKVYVLLEGEGEGSQSQQSSSSSSSSSSSFRPSASGTRARAILRLNMGERPRPRDTPICLSLLDAVLRPGTITPSPTHTHFTHSCTLSHSVSVFSLFSLSVLSHSLTVIVLYVT